MRGCVAGNRQLAGRSRETVTESLPKPSRQRLRVLRRCFGSESQATGREDRSAISRAPQRRAHAAWHANPRGEAIRGALDRVPCRVKFAQAMLGMHSTVCVLIIATRVLCGDAIGQRGCAGPLR
jgi:hypothetical protein